MLNLTVGEATLVLAGCAAAIGAVWVLFRRGIFGGAKPATTQETAGSAKP
jgi:hypothetical protein